VIHSTGDFDLYLPANMVLFALLCGSLSASGGAERTERPRRFSVRAAGLGATALAASLLAATLWGYGEIRRCAAVENAMAQASATNPRQTPSPADLAGTIGPLTTALEGRPDDAEAQQHLGELWIRLYRLCALQQLRDEKIAGVDDDALWAFTSLAALHGRAHYLAANEPPEFERLRQEPVLRENLLPALQHLLLARKACPLLPRTELMVAQLAFFIGDPASDRVPLARVRQLALPYPEVFFQCGLLELQAGRAAPAWESWRTCLALDSSYLAEVLRLASQHLTAEEMVESLLPDRPALLIQAARKYFTSTEEAEVRGLLGQRLEALADGPGLPEAQRHYLRGVALDLRELCDEAIPEYVQAVELSPKQTDWRYELAVLLQQQGKTQQAHEHAIVCARLQPNNPQYQALLRELNRARP
jgi:tetratricopeptide (TPR) repeat protein